MANLQNRVKWKTEDLKLNGTREFKAQRVIKR